MIVDIISRVHLNNHLLPLRLIIRQINFPKAALAQFFQEEEAAVDLINLRALPPPPASFLDALVVFGVGVAGGQEVWHVALVDTFADHLINFFHAILTASFDVALEGHVLVGVGLVEGVILSHDFLPIIFLEVWRWKVGVVDRIDLLIMWMVIVLPLILTPAVLNLILYFRRLLLVEAEDLDGADWVVGLHLVWLALIFKTLELQRFLHLLAAGGGAAAVACAWIVLDHLPTISTEIHVY